MAIERLVEDNIATLEQASGLIDSLARSGVNFGDRIGPHLRHVLDHYECFFTGLETGCMDYDDRGRSVDCERHLAKARQRIARIIARLEALTYAELPARVWVRLSTNADDTSTESWSSPIRELQFLQSHAVHHYALIGFIAAAAGVPLQSGFGKAPSTLRYERERASGG